VTTNVTKLSFSVGFPRANSALLANGDAWLNPVNDLLADTFLGSRAAAGGKEYPASGTTLWVAW